MPFPRIRLEPAGSPRSPLPTPALARCRYRGIPAFAPCSASFPTRIKSGSWPPITVRVELGRDCRSGRLLSGPTLAARMEGRRGTAGRLVIAGAPLGQGRPTLVWLGSCPDLSCPPCCAGDGLGDNATFTPNRCGSRSCSCRLMRAARDGEREPLGSRGMPRYGEAGGPFE